MTSTELDRPQFVFTEEHHALRGVLSEVFTGTEDAAAGWRTVLAELGADEIVFDAVAGSSSATPVELAILAEEAGAALFGGPLLPGALLGVLAAAAGRPDLSGAVRDGTHTVAAPVGDVPLDGGPDGVRVVAEPVWNGPGAHWVLVTGTIRHQPAVALLPAAGGTTRPLAGLDLSRPLARFTAEAIRPECGWPARRPPMSAGCSRGQPI